MEKDDDDDDDDDEFKILKVLKISVGMLNT